jgi:pimeloyl-ACP methyl ester carboxylesterase
MDHASAPVKSSTSVALPPTGPGTVSGSPGLPAGFTDMFRSELIDTDELRLHTVVGGDGPPLLLMPGWPQTWYAWRLVMPALATTFRVVAIDPRGVGRSDKPAGGYDTGTLASDAAAVMSALGHDRFAVLGHDVGMWTGYALASDQPERVERVVLMEAHIPGLIASPAVFAPQAAVNGLWHFTFNRLSDLNERLVEGRERLFFGWQFENKAAVPLDPTAVDVYIEALTAGPEALHASFGPYRALEETLAQNARRSATKLSMPVLTIAGARSLGETMGAALATAGEDVHNIVLDGVGHYPAEEAPTEVLAVVGDFLRPHRVGG